MTNGIYPPLYLREQRAYFLNTKLNEIRNDLRTNPNDQEILKEQNIVVEELLLLERIKKFLDRCRSFNK